MKSSTSGLKRKGRLVAFSSPTSVLFGALVFGAALLLAVGVGDGVADDGDVALGGAVPLPSFPLLVSSSPRKATANMRGLLGPMLKSTCSK